MRTVHVLLCSESGELVGGGELSLLDLVTALVPSRFAPVVVCPGPGALVERLRAGGIPVEILPFPPWRSLRAIGVLRTLARLAALVKARRISLLHVNATGRVALCAGLVGRWRRVPVIWHVRVKEPEGWKDRLLARLATRIVVNSGAVAMRFTGSARAKVTLIHNGIDLRRFTPGPPSEELRRGLGLPAGVPVVGSVGRFVAYKGYAYLLEAARLVRQKIPEARWILVGDGELRGELEAQCRRLGLDGAVTFAGWRERVGDYLALFDLFVLPSLGEHFGRVLLEAMAMGKAVVATDAGGVPEIVRHGETGLLVPPADPEAMAAAVVSLLQDRALASRLGAAGRRRVESEFSLGRHVEAVEAVYASLLDAIGDRL
ncbi:MAG: glycosyltransferase family 4 protein [Candidatus Rokubacteria bacterium]|nr:glycosyltransferase family 4 protein [Candidatus Rokubacteria bacterium]